MWDPVRALIVLCGGLSAVSPGVAQTAPPSSAPLYASRPIITSPMTGDERRQMVLVSVAIQPTGAVPMHTHPGDCVGTVVDGAVELLVEGQAPRRVAAGETYANPRGTVHGFRNVGDVPARLINSLVVDKGVPFVAPAASAPR